MNSTEKQNSPYTFIKRLDMQFFNKLRRRFYRQNVMFKLLEMIFISKTQYKKSDYLTLVGVYLSYCFYILF